MPAARERWPFRDAASELRHDAWVAQYDAASRAWATCALVESSGPGPSPVERALLAVHDEATGATTGLPLA